MTEDTFRRIALSMPEAVESEHMGHPDFRVKGKTFATLFARGEEIRGMVKLKPAQQRRLVKSRPDAFEPVNGAWGRQGCTQVCLDAVDKRTLHEAMVLAWRHAAPK